MGTEIAPAREGVMTGKLKIAIAAALISAGMLAVAVNALVSQVPFKGSDAGHFKLLGSCEGDGTRVVIEGAGNATRIGTYTYTANECFHPSTGAFSGKPTFTATNGDTMFGRYSGHVSATDDPNVVDYEEDLVISGGTGRFAGASERLHVMGVANLKTGEYSQTIDPQE